MKPQTGALVILRAGVAARGRTHAIWRGAGMMPGKRLWARDWLILEKNTGEGGHWCEGPGTDKDRLRIITKQLSRPGSYLMNQPFPKSFGIVLRSSVTRL